MTKDFRKHLDKPGVKNAETVSVADDGPETPQDEATSSEEAANQVDDSPSESEEQALPEVDEAPIAPLMNWITPTKPNDLVQRREESDGTVRLPRTAEEIEAEREEARAKVLEQRAPISGNGEVDPEAMIDADQLITTLDTLISQVNKARARLEQSDIMTAHPDMGGHQTKLHETLNQIHEMRSKLSTATEDREAIFNEMVESEDWEVHEDRLNQLKEFDIQIEVWRRKVKKMTLDLTEQFIRDARQESIDAVNNLFQHRHAHRLPEELVQRRFRDLELALRLFNVGTATNSNRLDSRGRDLFRERFETRLATEGISLDDLARPEADWSDREAAARKARAEQEQHERVQVARDEAQAAEMGK